MKLVASETWLTENDLVAAVEAHLAGDGWTILHTSRTTEHGIDILAEKDGGTLAVEVKGGGSSKPGTTRFGRPFTPNQKRSHVAMAVLTALRQASRGQHEAAFRPKGHYSVWLFVTEKKTPDRTQYRDHLEGDVLDWDGQTRGLRDKLIIEHDANGLELLLFYRESRRQYPHAGFRYEGPFRYVSHEGEHPAHFVLRRTDSAGRACNLQN